MSSTLDIFVTGATGYLGGTIIDRLLRHPNSSSFKIKALVRSTEKGEILRTLNIEPIIGSYNDENLQFLVDAASKADVVIAVADSDNLPAAQAILDGLKIRHETTKKVPILIHTSGTATVADDARGLHANKTVYSDLDVDFLNSLPLSALHRNIDAVLIDADQKGYVKTYIIVPSAIFGEASGTLTDLGIQKKPTFGLPLFVNVALRRKQVGYFGQGLNLWSGVDVGETADLFLIVLESALKGNDEAGHGREGYYFAESASISLLEFTRVIANTLFELGVTDKKQPNAFLDEELETIGPLWKYLAANMVVRGERGRALGWKPIFSKEDISLYVVSEVKRIISEQTE